MARGLGVPIRIDHSTLHGEVGLFARVLVDVDLSTRLPESLFVDDEGDFIEVSVVYEKCPEFCTACQSVGHSVSSCRLVQRQFQNTRNVTKSNDSKIGGRETEKPSSTVPRQMYVPKAPLATEPSATGKANSFAALAPNDASTSGSKRIEVEEYEVSEADLQPSLVDKLISQKVAQEIAAVEATETQKELDSGLAVPCTDIIVSDTTSDQGVEIPLTQSPLDREYHSEGEQDTTADSGGIWETPKRGRTWKRGRLRKGMTVSSNKERSLVTSKPVTRAVSKSLK